MSSDSTRLRPVSPHDLRVPRVACLQLVSGPGRVGLLFELREGTWVIGRAPEADWRIKDDGVSRRHVKVVVRQEATQLVDLESLNGTFVDGEKIEAIVLQDDMQIALGPDVVLRFGFYRRSAIEEQSQRAELPKLSKRETEVARAVARGLSNAVVASELGISPRTVAAHLSNIYDALGFRTRSSLTRYMLEHGLVADDADSES